MSGFDWGLPSLPPPAPSTTPVEVTAGAIDHTQGMLDRLPVQFRKPNIELLVRALCEPIQTFENLAIQVLVGGTLDDAVGDDLVVLGKIVGQARGLVSDDEVFRRLIRARIITNRSIGVSSDLIRITRLIINSPDTDVDISARRVATVRVTLSPLPDVSTIQTLLGFLNLARGQAIRVVIHFSRDSATAFRFNSGLGFNQGHLAGSVGTS